jgi:hypothetical protein
MTSYERLENAFLGKHRDRTPILGGWLACPAYIQELAGASEDEYWQDPEGLTVAAYRELQMDGLVDLYIPRSRSDFRIVDANSFRKADLGLDLDDVLDEVEKAPSGPEIESAFDFEAEYLKLKDSLIHGQTLCGDMLWLPAQWGAGAKLQRYDDYGYENFFMIVGAYPEHAAKLMEIGGATGFIKSKLITRAVQEGIFPHAVFLGEDICTQRGPMVSPDFLKKFYAPQLERGLAQLLEVGCKPVWHSDGDVRLMLDMLIGCGIKGFQGFQSECGLTIEHMAKKRTSEGDPLLFFGPIAVTTELPALSPSEIRKRVRNAINVCEGNADLVLFTSNTINPDIPLENIKAMYEEALMG